MPNAIVEQVRPAPNIEAALRAFCRLPHCLLLDSAARHPRLGRYSFLVADPFDYLELSVDGEGVWETLARRLEGWTTPTLSGLPPFQGGAAGMFGYDLNRGLAGIPRPKHDEFGVPALAVGLYDVVLAFDHQTDQAWLISQGTPEVEPTARQNRARQRLAYFRAILDGRDNASSLAVDSTAHRTLPTLTIDRLAPQHAVPGRAGLTSNFAADDYCRAVQQIVEFIQAGSVSEVNLAQRLLYPAATDSVSLYLRLRQRNPAPFAAYFDLGAFQIVSASPERFLEIRDGDVETRPIKGTRRRTFFPESDLFAAHDLRTNAKDRAENLLTVDLLRDELSQVCEPDSVRVTQLCEVEVYQYVQHLVSAIRGRLDTGRTALDLLRAVFPGVSVTGAPRTRAMEIIAALEPTARGPYCGCLGYLGFDGAMDLNVLIRTIIAGRGWWQLPVGGGIVAQSNPRAEYEETWGKAAGMLKALH